MGLMVSLLHQAPYDTYTANDPKLNILVGVAMMGTRMLFLQCDRRL